MAPEILLGRKYQGFSIDLFSCGIILFIMVAQSPPFIRALPTDPIYRLLAENRDDLFWAAHSKNKPLGFYSESFKVLVTGLLQYEPSTRYTMNDLLASEWFRKTHELPTREQIIKEFTARRASIIDQQSYRAVIGAAT
jgi:serine/threonine protein kinase